MVSTEALTSEYRAASTPTISTRSSIVTTFPARLDMRTGSPPRTRLTNWPMRMSMFRPGPAVSPKARAIAYMRPMYP